MINPNDQRRLDAKEPIVLSSPITRRQQYVAFALLVVANLCVMSCLLLVTRLNFAQLLPVLLCVCVVIYAYTKLLRLAELTLMGDMFTVKTFFRSALPLHVSAITDTEVYPGSYTSHLVISYRKGKRIVNVWLPLNTGENDALYREKVLRQAMEQYGREVA